MAVEFQQWVSQDYVWVEGVVKDRTETGLAAHPCARKERPNYEPMTDEPALFRKFVKAGRMVPVAQPTADTLRNVREFTLKYGELGLAKQMSITDESSLPKWASGNGKAFVETLNDWFCQASLMIAAMIVHETIQKAENGNAEAQDQLRRIVNLGRMEGPYRCSCYIEGPTTRNAPYLDLNLARHAYLRPAYQNRNRIMLAKAALVEFVNERLDDSDATHSGGITYINRGNTRAGLVPKGVGAYRLSTVPTGLVGALWLQFAQMLAGRQWRECHECGTDFEVGFEKYSSQPAKRRSARFCSDACRWVYHNKRRKTASEHR